MESIAGKSDQYLMRTLNSNGSTRVGTVRKEVAYCVATRFIPSLRLEARGGDLFDHGLNSKPHSLIENLSILENSAIT